MMFDQNQNPMPIQRLELGKTRQHKKTVINLYSGALEKPLLVIPEHDFGMLIDAGLDPNALEWGKTYHVRMLAYWEDSEYTSSMGTNYRDVLKLVDNNPEAQSVRAFRIAVGSQLQLQSDLLVEILEAIRQTGFALPERNPN